MCSYIANGLVYQTLISAHGFKHPAECLVNCLYHFRSEIIIRILYIVNWQVLSRVMTGDKQTYKMNNMTTANVIVKFTSFIL